MKFYKAISVFVVFILLCTTFAATINAEEFNKEATKGVACLVLFVFDDDDNLIGIASGSGFFIGKEGESPQYLITNYHVVEEFTVFGGANNLSRLYVVYADNDYEELYITDFNKEADLAITKIAKPTQKRIPLKMGATSEENVASTVYALGYPAAAENVGSVSQFGLEDLTLTSGIISRLVTMSGSGTKVLNVDLKISGGNSGGPLVNANGDVLGINTFKIGELSYAVASEEAMALLNKNGIAYDKATEGADVEQATTQPLPEAALAEPTVFTAQDFSLAIYIFMAFLALFILFTLIFAYRKNLIALFGKNKKQQTTPAKKPVVRSMSAQHNGLTKGLSSEAIIIIGRDVVYCAIIFKEGTPAVSKKHCSLCFDGENFILTDLSSSYGTFLTGGTRLTGQVPYTLKAKDSFYLGDTENILYVDMVE